MEVLTEKEIELYKRRIDNASLDNDFDILMQIFANYPNNPAYLALMEYAKKRREEVVEERKTAEARRTRN